MIRAKDVVVLAALAWFLLRDTETTSVELTQTCVDAEGNQITVPLGECPEGYTLVIEESPYATPPYAGLQGCGGGCGCADCAG